jgi:hypothetical protein
MSALHKTTTGYSHWPTESQCEAIVNILKRLVNVHFTHTDKVMDWEIANLVKTIDKDYGVAFVGYRHCMPEWGICLKTNVRFPVESMEEFDKLKGPAPRASAEWSTNGRKILAVKLFNPVTLLKA